MTFPLCCTPPDFSWPFPQSLPATQLVRTEFDPARLDPLEFDRLGLAVPRGVPKRQAEVLASRACAQAALQRLTGVAGLPGKDEQGMPSWPEGIVGSLTHSHGRAAVVIGEAKAWRGLGLDLEALIPPARAERLSGEILTPAERQHLARLPEDARAWRITLTFSFKESLFKALFPLVRQRFYFQDAELLGLADGHARLRLLSPLAPDWPAGRELVGQYAEGEGHLLTLVHIDQAP
ncbi:4'-phosphopantetheinyl transferase family protein [Stutzerimonas tarimensis]|uniref:Enterobactin synthase component D n=1 Tax=Stutzerimonas tarimensis TaxID=1507735 RepID=A0ABV7T8I3_9GAMM